MGIDRYHSEGALIFPYLNIHKGESGGLDLDSVARLQGKRANLKIALTNVHFFCLCALPSLLLLRPVPPFIVSNYLSMGSTFHFL